MPTVPLLSWIILQMTPPMELLGSLSRKYLETTGHERLEDTLWICSTSR